jgi:serine/threonine protein kinase
MGTNGCPSPEELSALAVGKLAPPSLSRVQGHAAGCAACRRLLADLEGGPEAAGPPARESSAPAEVTPPPGPADAARETTVLRAGSSPLLYLGPVRTPTDDTVPAVDQFVHDLVESKLLTAAEVRAVLGGLSPEIRSDARRVAGELVRQGKLTRYQAAMLLQGRTRGFLMGNYTILDKLGAGGMGMVFKAEHRRMKRVVALKLVPPDRMKKPEAVARFQREVEAAARLSHPNIVTAYDADRAKGVHFLVMEYVEGGDLQQTVRRQGPLPVGQAVDCVLQAARGLAHAHAAGIVHRDITPANLLLNDRGVVKILDMGLAHVEEVSDPDRQAETVIMGTMDYLAPEQAANPAAADQRSDVYSLGCTLFFLLTGRPVYRGETAIEKLLAHRKAPIPSLCAQRPEVPETLDRVFQRMAAKRPEDRYASMEDVVAALEACQAGSGRDPEPADAPETNPWASLASDDDAPESPAPPGGVAPTVRVRTPARRPAWRARVAAACTAAAVLAVFLLARVLTVGGEVVLEAADDEAARLLGPDGVAVVHQETRRPYALHLGRQELPRGEYLAAAPPSARVELAVRRFSVTRGRDVRLAVRSRSPE